MKREIRLSKRAMQKLDSLLVYLEEEWSTKVKYEFVQKLDKSLKQIQKLPDSFPESEKIRGLRKCVVTKQTTVFYRYSEATIDVVTIFDNRKNPKSLKKETKE
ncbi:MAG: type II toxin-antitoxin system RelE/ParE family toxin [Tenuifilaceae bacterium]|jgi:plasmid stabilization system protein ParE|nr:type II toxin-antitoxin system RelE/ParE family toxin [Bacteroidales bacterium]MDI9516391.1 type II toxin-antitoxin system RelE/ParE family toxin [Bacteroidota bacterium]NLH56675.1 type II toxin-antitoxin system RelE/ParE family toxin [Rikenellaceae bacterium]OQC62225.1 MAG: Toxin ParE1 [Bacteroidetes bacterium ADurb.Bin008]HNV81104.1 type II toxin-antitoxin system RelE/ParE family toxin [Tenuifilaceae bacterium]